MRDMAPTQAERKRILREARAREARKAQKRKRKPAGESSLPKHLQPDFTPMSSTRQGTAKRSQFY